WAWVREDGGNMMGAHKNKRASSKGRKDYALGDHIADTMDIKARSRRVHLILNGKRPEMTRCGLQLFGNEKSGIASKYESPGKRETRGDLCRNLATESAFS